MIFQKSNLSLHGITKITIHYNKYNPTHSRGSSYAPLPEWIALKKACINIKNNDNKCFKYCIECMFYKIYDKTHPEKNVSL